MEKTLRDEDRTCNTILLLAARLLSNALDRTILLLNLNDTKLTFCISLPAPLKLITLDMHVFPHPPFFPKRFEYFSKFRLESF